MYERRGDNVVFKSEMNIYINDVCAINPAQHEMKAAGGYGASHVTRHTSHVTAGGYGARAARTAAEAATVTQPKRRT